MYEIGFIGFGEAAAAFVKGWRDAGLGGSVAAYDLLLDDTIRALADYTLERVAVHGLRRGAEMDEVCATLRDLGVPDAMSEASATTQKAIGALRLASLPPDAERVAGAALAALERAGTTDGEDR